MHQDFADVPFLQMNETAKSAPDLTWNKSSFIPLQNCCKHAGNSHSVSGKIFIITVPRPTCACDNKPDLSWTLQGQHECAAGEIIKHSSGNPILYCTWEWEPAAFLILKEWMLTVPHLGAGVSQENTAHQAFNSVFFHKRHFCRRIKYH